jgi:predicted DNA-binding transcriptional regulator AlpA
MGIYLQTERGETMQDLQPVLHAEDIVKLFGVSRATVYRWIVEAREGRSRFPLPINNGVKRKLLWNRSDILAFQFQNGNGTPPLPETESAGQRKKRYTAALARLRQKGVKISK